MSRQYCAYLSGIERQELIRDYTFEIESARIDLILEAIDRKQEIQMKEAEIKVLTEGGTYSDLDMLYGEIFNEASASTEKMSIGQRIAHLINLLIDAFQSLFTGKSDFLADKKPTDTVKVDSGYNKRMGIIRSILEPIRAIFEFVKKGIKNLLTSADRHKVVTAFVAAGATIGGVALLTSDKDDNKTDTKKVKEIEDDASMCVEALNMMNDLNKEIEDAKKKIDEAEKEIAKKKNENNEMAKKEAENNSNSRYAKETIDSLKEKRDNIKRDEVYRTGSDKLKKWSAKAADEWDKLDKQIKEAEDRKQKAEKEISQNRITAAANSADVDRLEQEKREAEKTINDANAKKEQIKKEEEQRNDEAHKKDIQNNVDNSNIKVDDKNNVTVNGKPVNAEVKGDVIYIDGAEFDNSEKEKNERTGMFNKITDTIHKIINFFNEQRKKLFSFLGKKMDQVTEIVDDAVHDKYDKRTSGDKKKSTDDETDNEDDEEENDDRPLTKKEKRKEKRYMRVTYGNRRAQ